jgi:hypothetical protein
MYKGIVKFRNFRVVSHGHIDTCLIVTRRKFLLDAENRETGGNAILLWAWTHAKYQELEKE